MNTILKKFYFQEPPEAMVYLDARSQDGSSTHGSTSDDTGSSLSTVVDRFSSSDRVSTISTVSTTSTTSEQQGTENSKEDPNGDHYNDSQVKEFLTDNLNLSGMLSPFDQLEREFSSNPPDYLLTRLANSEAVTHVESRGDVERVTAVVAPNTVLIEETITLQPPLSFQDAPLSYGHETSPGIFYTDLAADSKTHFRPIKDDASIVESVNGDLDHLSRDFNDNHDKRNSDLNSTASNGTAPPLPIRNHVNRIPVNQQILNGEKRPSVDEDPGSEVPILPPKPMPRKDLKSRRKRPPPPPPPPATAPRREVPPVPEDTFVRAVDQEADAVQVSETRELEEQVENKKSCSERELSKLENGLCGSDDEVSSSLGSERRTTEEERVFNEETKNEPKIEKSCRKIVDSQINKSLDIIEMKVKVSNESQLKSSSTTSEDPEGDRRNEEATENSKKPKGIDDSLEKRKLADMSNTETLSIELEDSGDERVVNLEEMIVLEKSEDVKPILKIDFDDKNEESELIVSRSVTEDKIEDSERDYSDGEEESKDIEIKMCYKREEEMEDDNDSSGESDGDYYWQSNLATIGEEEETNSLEYNNA